MLYCSKDIVEFTIDVWHKTQITVHAKIDFGLQSYLEIL